MITNPWPALFYLLLVMAFLLLPYLSRRQGTQPASDPGDSQLAVLLVAGGCLLAFLRDWVLIEGSLLLLLTAYGRSWRALAGAAAAALLFSTATWWLKDYGISQGQRMLFAGVCLLLALVSRWARFAETTDARTARGTRAELAIIGVLLTLGLVAGLLTGAENAPETAIMAWHHWGAYVSPVNSLLAGGVPYRDFPVQYGMGPTLLIAASCSIGCWTGIYSLTVVTNALELAVFGWAMLLLTRKLDLPSRLLALAALVCSMYIWTGYPSNWGNPIMTPSVGGMRFLPLVLLVGLILTLEHGAPPAATRISALPRWFVLSGIGLWLLGLMWSPENAFFASLVWWPYLALRRADAGEAGRAAWLCLLRGGIIGLAAVLAGYLGLALLFRLLFGDWVSLSNFLLYLRYPPGALPVNALGPFWFVAALLLLAWRALSRQQHSVQSRSLYVCLLAALAALSYYLSRSHDNNILNLLPFLLLVLLATHALLPTQFITAFVRAALVAVIAFTASIHYHRWTVFPGAPSVAGLQVGSSALTTRFSPSLKQAGRLQPDEVAAAFDDLHNRGFHSILLFNGNEVMPLGEPSESWTFVNNLANILPLPDDVIRHYVWRGAVVLHRPGWIVLSRKDCGIFLRLFLTAYDVTEERRYGSYSAYHLVPRDVR